MSDLSKMKSATTRLFFFVLLALFAFPLVAQDNNAKSVSQRLESAKAAYKSNLAKASQSLLYAIDAEIKRAEDNSNLSVEAQLTLLKELKSDRKAFSGNRNKVPTHRRLKTEAADYQRELRESKRALEKAFDEAADALRKPPIKDFEAAARVLKERDSFFTAGSKKKPTGTDTFEPAFNDKNWKVSVPKLLKVEDGVVTIKAASSPTLLLTQKSNYEDVDLTIELSASRGTEAFIMLNALNRNGQWTGGTSRIHYENGKILGGGQRTGFRPNSGNQQEFAPDEFFTVRLKLFENPSNPDSAVITSYLNGKRTAGVAYGWQKTNRLGAVGIVVKKGSVAIKSFKITSGKK